MIQRSIQQDHNALTTGRRSATRKENEGKLEVRCRMTKERKVNDGSWVKTLSEEENGREEAG